MEPKPDKPENICGMCGQRICPSQVIEEPDFTAYECPECGQWVSLFGTVNAAEVFGLTPPGKTIESKQTWKN